MRGKLIAPISINSYAVAIGALSNNCATAYTMAIHTSCSILRTGCTRCRVLIGRTGNRCVCARSSLTILRATYNRTGTVVSDNLSARTRVSTRIRLLRDTRGNLIGCVVTRNIDLATSARTRTGIAVPGPNRVHCLRGRLDLGGGAIRLSTMATPTNNLCRDVA